MRFWVHGRGIDETETLGWLKQPLRDLRGWAEVQYENLREQYLMDRLDEGVQEGDAQVRTDATTTAAGAAEQQQLASGWLGGMFGALKPNVQGPSRGGSGGGKRALPPPGTYTSGEARADFVKVRRVRLCARDPWRLIQACSHVGPSNGYIPSSDADRGHSFRAVRRTARRGLLGGSGRRIAGGSAGRQ